MPGQRIFTTWFTSMADAMDHAVIDEEFIAHRPEPEAICGVVVVLAPLAYPLGSRCARCVAFLRARESLRDFDQREAHRHCRPSLLAHLLRVVLSTHGGGDHASPTAAVPAVSRSERAR